MTHTLRPSPTAILNPRNDAIFKAIFTQDTDESRLALRSFLSAMIGKQVSNVELQPNEPATEILNQLQMSFDVSVIFDDGEKADIEIQNRQEDYDYACRAETQVARLLSTSSKKGSNWDSKKVYQISLLNFEFQKDDNSPFSWYTMRNERGLQLSDRLNVIFLDLIKIKSLLGTPINELSKAEKWGLYFAYADCENQQNYIRQITNTEEGIMAADFIVTTMSKEDAAWFRQNSIDTARRDYNTGMENALKRGLERGARQKAVEATRNLLAMHILTNEQIAQVEGISLEEVQALAKENL